MTMIARRTAPAARVRAHRLTATVAGLCAAAVLTLSGCGDTKAGSSGSGSQDQGSVPDGWGTLTTKGVDVSYPKSGPVAYTPQNAAERGRADAAAVHTEGDTRLSTITVELDFTKARTAEEAATGAEAGVQLGATLEGTRRISVDGTDDARRVDFTFTSTGRAHTPPKGTKVHGVIVTGLDSTKTTFAVRIDAQQGLLPDADLKKIINSIQVH